MIEVYEPMGDEMWPWHQWGAICELKDGAMYIVTGPTKKVAQDTLQAYLAMHGIKKEDA